MINVDELIAKVEMLNDERDNLTEAELDLVVDALILYKEINN